MASDSIISARSGSGGDRDEFPGSRRGGEGPCRLGDAWRSLPPRQRLKHTRASYKNLFPFPFLILLPPFPPSLLDLPIPCASSPPPSPPHSTSFAIVLIFKICLRRIFSSFSLLLPFSLIPFFLFYLLHILKVEDEKKVFYEKEVIYSRSLEKNEKKTRKRMRKSFLEGAIDLPSSGF